jgi:hypothetical protein
MKADYPAPIADLLRLMKLAPLGPGKPDESVRGKLKAMDDRSLWPGDPGMAAACRAGLWLAFDHLDESHAISQELHTAEGSYWHAILHRREPDAWNSKYWWRQVGNHPVFERLAGEAARLGWRSWDPAAFVDACERERDTGSEGETLLREVQRAEWELLFDWCFQRGTGRGNSSN